MPSNILGLDPATALVIRLSFRPGLVIRPIKTGIIEVDLFGTGARRRIERADKVGIVWHQT